MKYRPQYSYKGRRAGFRLTELISDENTIPIPTPAPASPIVANPAPMYFAACNILIYIFVSKRKLVIKYDKKTGKVQFISN